MTDTNNAPLKCFIKIYLTKKKSLDQEKKNQFGNMAMWLCLGICKQKIYLSICMIIINVIKKMHF